MRLPERTFKGGNAAARRQISTALCGKHSGKAICFDIQINKPESFTRMRTGQGGRKTGDFRAGVRRAVDPPEKGFPQIVKSTGVDC